MHIACKQLRSDVMYEFPFPTPDAGCCRKCYLSCWLSWGRGELTERRQEVQVGTWNALNLSSDLNGLRKGEVLLRGGGGRGRAEDKINV